MQVLFTYRKHGFRQRFDVETIPTLDQMEKIEEEVHRELNDWEETYGVNEGDFQVICHQALEKYVRIKHNTLVATFDF